MTSVHAYKAGTAPRADSHILCENTRGTDTWWFVKLGPQTCDIHMNLGLMAGSVTLGKSLSPFTPVKGGQALAQKAEKMTACGHARNCCPLSSAHLSTPGLSVPLCTSPSCLGSQVLWLRFFKHAR